MMNKTALVVDDDQNIRVMLGRALRNDGFHVDFADDGAQALELLGVEHQYEVILLDLMMKGMDGFGLLEELKERDPARLSSIIVITAIADQSGEKLRSSGVHTVLQKPLEIPELLGAVHDCIRSNAAMKAERELEN